MAVQVIETQLPGDPHRYQLGIPTYGRGHTSLPSAVYTIADAVQDAGIERDTRFLVADGTPNLSAEQIARNLHEYHFPVPLYFLTQETQLRAARDLSSRLGIREETVRRIMLETSCGGNRQKLAIVSGGYVLGRRESFVGALIDDDLQVDRTVRLVKGFRGQPNSQVIINLGSNGEPEFEYFPNGSIYDQLLSIPGLTIDQLRQKFPDVLATRTWVDTMHRQLSQAQRTGSAVFEVNPSGEEINDGTVFGVSVLKHRKPDYRTVEVAKSALLNEFPSHELPIESYPIGSNRLFLFRECDTNVDAAFSAWMVDDMTVRLPFSFVISQQISLENPLQTVTTQTRADNELLPKLLQRIFERTGVSFLYATGSNFHAQHLRESSGYRPNIIEQAATSLVDNLYAQAANDLIKYTRDMSPYMEDQDIEQADIVPEEKARTVFDRMRELAEICTVKIQELSQRTTHGSDEEAELQDKISNYRKVFLVVKGKLGVIRYEEENKKVVPISKWDEVAFTDWKREIEIVGRKQLHFYNDVLRHTPEVMEETGRMIRRETGYTTGYPALLVVPDNMTQQTISLPGLPTRRV
jgi:hypothetical protein